MGLECEYNDTLEKKTVSILDTQSQWPPLAILMIGHIAEVSEQ